MQVQVQKKVQILEKKLLPMSDMTLRESLSEFNSLVDAILFVHNTTQQSVSYQIWGQPQKITNLRNGRIKYSPGFLADLKRAYPDWKKILSEYGDEVRQQTAILPNQALSDAERQELESLREMNAILKTALERAVKIEEKVDLLYSIVMRQGNEKGT